jgi:hypothetical protein
MKCPFCETLLKSVGLICPTCKSSLPKVELFPIYGRLLIEQRDLGKAENRIRLDELATQEYQIRRQLIEAAKNEESERLRNLKIQKEESLRKLKAEKVRKTEEQKLKRAKSNKVTGKVLIVTLVILSILGTGKITFNIFENRKIAQDCVILNTPLINSGVDKVGIPVDIANLSFLIKSYPYSPYFDFKTAGLYLQERESIFASQTYQSTEVSVFAEKYQRNATKMSELLQQGSIGQAIGDIKQGKGSLQDLATQQIALFNSNPCYDEASERENAIESLPVGSKLRSEFTSKFLVSKSVSETTPEPTAKPSVKTTKKAVATVKPSAKPTPPAKPTFMPASASSYVQRFTLESIDCKFDALYSIKYWDTSARCYSSDIWVNNHGANKLDVDTSQRAISDSCSINSPSLPTLNRNVAYFRSADAYFVISSGTGDKEWLNTAAQIIMNTFGANFCA